MEFVTGKVHYVTIQTLKELLLIKLKRKRVGAGLVNIHCILSNIFFPSFSAMPMLPQL